MLNMASETDSQNWAQILAYPIQLSEGIIFILVIV